MRMPTVPDTVKPNTRRLNINLPASVYEELQAIAARSHRNMTDLVRLALGLVKIAIEEEARGNRLIIGSQDGKVLREVVLPR